MKKMLTFIWLMIFLMSVQVAVGQTINTTETADIPLIKGRASLKQQRISIADFDYTLQGDISSASLDLKWGSKFKWAPLWGLSQLDLYLDNKLLIDFGQYFKPLRWRDRVALAKSLRKGGMIDLRINIDRKDFAYLEDGKAELYLVGKPRFYRNLRLGDITLKIADPISKDIPGTQPNDGPTIQPGYGPGIQFVDGIQFVNGPGTPSGSPTSPTQSVPEPSTILLLGSGLIGLWGVRRKFKK